MQQLECERMFVAVLETGSFTRAAKRLGSSPGQASKLVSRLEAELGVTLLNRTTRALAATEIDAWRAHLEAKGVAIESDFLWPNRDEAKRGRSIYFRDPAGNSVEIAEPRIWGV